MRYLKRPQILNMTLVLAMEELEKEEPSLDKVKTAVYESFELLANMHMDINISRSTTRETVEWT